MSFVRARQRPDFLVRSASSWSLSITVEQDGAAVTPSAATLTLRTTNGTKVIDAGAATPGTTTTYAGTADLTSYAYASDWTAEWALTIGGVVYYFVGLVVLSRVGEPAAPITEDDLKRAHSDLTRSTMLPQGKASFQPYIDMAMDECIRRLMRSPMKPHMVVDWSAFAGWTHAYTMHVLCRDIAVVEAGDGKWTELRDYYERKADGDPENPDDMGEWGKLAFRVDRDQDATIDSGDEVTGSPNVGAGGLYGRPMGGPA